MTKAQQTYKAPKEKGEYREFKAFLSGKCSLCQICGNVAQDLHHLFYGSYGADKDDTMLIAVCRGCHEYCHKNKKKSQRLYKNIAKNNLLEFKKFVK